jgi:transcriptional regulator with XRE-family HTH domain
MTAKTLARNAKNRSELARACNVTPSIIAHIAAGRRLPSLDLACKLARATGMKLDAAALTDSAKIRFVRGDK